MHISVENYPAAAVERAMKIEEVLSAVTSGFRMSASSI
jgi:hypothetical protein